MKTINQVIVLALILVSVTGYFVLFCQENEKTIVFQAIKWIEGKAPDEYIDVSNLSLRNEIIAWVKFSATEGPVIVSESNSIKPWADKIIEESVFDSVNIKISENEYYQITLR